MRCSARRAGDAQERELCKPFHLGYRRHNRHEAEAPGVEPLSQSYVGTKGGRIISERLNDESVVKGVGGVEDCLNVGRLCVGTILQTAKSIPG